MILVPYLWSAAYAVLLSGRGETYAGAQRQRYKDLLVGLIALVYALWLLYAGGLKYLLLSALLYAPGVVLFALAKREQGQPLFTHWEKGIFSCVIAGAGLAAYGLYSGVLSL
jgi:arginine:ornithine antiporter/lysine permease